MNTTQKLADLKDLTIVQNPQDVKGGTFCLVAKILHEVYEVIEYYKPKCDKAEYKAPEYTAPKCAIPAYKVPSYGGCNTGH